MVQHIGFTLAAVAVVAIGVSAGLRSAAQPAHPIINVTSVPFGARCDGKSDDTAAIQKAEQAAVRLSGVVTLPRGRCAISGPIAWDSNVSLNGAGMYASTLVALPNFGFDPAKVRAKYDGRFVGMIWLDGPTETTPLTGVTISNV